MATYLKVVTGIAEALCVQKDNFKALYRFTHGRVRRGRKSLFFQKDDGMFLKLKIGEYIVKENGTLHLMTPTRFNKFYYPESVAVTVSFEQEVK